MRVTMLLFHTFRNDHRVLKEARTLTAAGYSVTIVAMREDDELPKEAMQEGIRVCRIPLHRWPFRKGRYLEFFLRGAWMAWRTDADVYHSHDLDTLVPGFIAARLRKKPLVYDSHELFTETHFLIGRERERRTWAFLEKHLIGFASRVVTVSGPIAQELQKRYCVPRPTVIRNIPSFSPPPKPRPFFPDLPDRPIFLCQGYLQKGRGLETLVLAMASVTRARLVLLGDGELRGELKRLVARENLESRVHLLPAVPIEELPSRTAAAMVGLIAYSTESLNFRYALPNKFFEYVMAGVPVLTSNIPEVAKLVHEYRVGRVVHRCTPEGFASEMERLIHEPETIEEMRRNCVKAAQELRWENEEKKLLRLYETLKPAQQADHAS